MMVQHEVGSLLAHHLFPLSCSAPSCRNNYIFGANDAALLGRTSERLHVPIEEYKENLRKIVYRLKECSPTMLVVLITPPPVDEDGRKELQFLYMVTRQWSCQKEQTKQLVYMLSSALSWLKNCKFRILIYGLKCKKLLDGRKCS
ncbi:GDSL esterase/lipase [Iris pallida]|uniref:GDSL esterase/lipase n=1 Tax=Iris pallida TaxID=29817 RepID=A0AAX6F4Y4_IRIPA|nr:GDSL esterase/lipase [Iris pallida]